MEHPMAPIACLLCHVVLHPQGVFGAAWTSPHFGVEPRTSPPNVPWRVRRSHSAPRKTCRVSCSEKKAFPWALLAVCSIIYTCFSTARLIPALRGPQPVFLSVCPGHRSGEGMVMLTPLGLNHHWVHSGQVERSLD